MAGFDWTRQPARARTREKSGLVSKSIFFVLRVKSLLTEKESHLVKEYGLRKELIYSSERSRASKEKAGKGEIWNAAAC